MADLIDIFTLPQDEDVKMSFIVDNTQDYITLFSTNFEYKTIGFGVDGRLQQGDNFNILSLGLSMPEMYRDSLLVDSPSLNLGVNLASVESGTIKRIFDSVLPFVNYELSINNFIENNVVVGEHTAIMDAGITIAISMNNVPDSENGKEYFVKPFIKIAHTLPIV